MSTSRKSLMVIWALMPMVLVFSGSFKRKVVISSQEQQNCNWQLVNTQESMAGNDETGGLLAYRNGNSIVTSHFQAETEYCAEQTFYTTHTWTEPGDVLTPGQEIPLSVSVDWNLDGERTCSSLTTGVHTTLTAGDTSVTARQDHIAVSVEPDGLISNSGSWVVPSGSSAGDTLDVKAYADSGGVGGFVSYSYQYVCESPTEQPKEIPAETETPEPAAYRLSMIPAPHSDPLKFGFQLEKKEANAEGYTPVPGAILKVQVLSYSGNENRLADEFLAPACQNCTSRQAGGLTLSGLKDTTQPIELATNDAGQADLGLFLDFGKLGNQTPQADAPLSIPVAVEAWATENGQEKKVAELQENLSLDAIGVVLAVTYEGPQMYDEVSGSPLPKGGGPLDSYYDDPGTRDGPRTLTGASRVLIQRPGEAVIYAPGSTPGTKLVAGNLLHSGDRVTINACDMVTNLIVNGLPAGAPGVIWVKVRFFDGVKAKVGVNGSVCRSAVTFGQSPESSGWMSGGQKFFYWSANGTMDAIIGNYLWPYKIVSGMNSVGKFLAWAVGNESAGWSPVYIKVNSAFAVDFNEDGTMRITTREGEPEVFTPATGEAGVSVPVGNTARVQNAQDVVVEQTSPDVAQQVDAWLVDLEQEDSIKAEPNSTSPNKIPIIGNLSTSIVITGIVLIVLLLGLVVVLLLAFGVWRFGKSRRPGGAMMTGQKRFPWLAVTLGVGCLGVLCVGVLVFGGGAAFFINKGATSRSAPEPAYEIPGGLEQILTPDTSSSQGVASPEAQQTTDSIPLAATSTTAPAAGISCPGAPASRLKVGSQATVGDVGGYSLTVYAEPGYESAEAYYLEEGDSFSIIGGPTCIKSQLWWEINRDQGHTGWVPESSETGGYLLNP